MGKKNGNIDFRFSPSAVEVITLTGLGVFPKSKLIEENETHHDANVLYKNVKIYRRKRI